VEETTDSWDHAGYHVEAEKRAYDDKINNGTKVMSTTAEKGRRKEPTE
jgi:hypothetical protein